MSTNRTIANINRTLNDANDAAHGNNEDYNKILNNDAPPVGYLGTKGPCRMLVIPPHPSHGVDRTMTSGGFRLDEKTGVSPTLGDYALDWVYVYKNVGNDPDPKRRQNILAVDMVTNPEDGSVVVRPEQDWGRVYKSPMYKLREFLWRATGSPKFDKKSNKTSMTESVDTSSALYRRAMELMPPGTALTNAIARPSRTMLLQGFVFENGGKEYTVNDKNEPCWPQHRVLMISQTSGIKSSVTARHREGFYDAFFVPSPNSVLGAGTAPGTAAEAAATVDPDSVAERYGDIVADVEARARWEAENFMHADFGSVDKLVTFESFKETSTVAYRCEVKNLADEYGVEYVLPEEERMKVRPISSYLIETNYDKQVEWLVELFKGDEWILEAAGVLQPSGNAVTMYTPPAKAAPVVPPARPVAATPAAVRPADAAQVYAAPATKPPVPGAPRMPTAPVAQAPAAPAPRAPAAPGSIVSGLQDRLSKITGKAPVAQPAPENVVDDEQE